MPDINSYKNINLPDLQQIILGDRQIKDHEDYGVLHGPVIKINNLSMLKEISLNRKFNLIYKDENRTLNQDPYHTKSENSFFMEDILQKHKDQFFMIIDSHMFDTIALSKYDNCQIWKRKYFPREILYTTKKEDSSLIQEQRQHWFCCVLGRLDCIRSMLFDWIIENNLHDDNKISYLGYCERTRRFSESEYRKIHSPKNVDLLPFNNFESTQFINDNRHTEEFREKIASTHDCLFNLVVETFSAGDRAHLTEKSYKSFVAGQIPIIVGSPGVMKRAQDLGVIIPDYIKWSLWDDLPVGQLNLDKIQIIQRQLKKLFDTHTIEDISKDWYPYAKRNFKTFMTLEQNCLEEEKEICRWILSSCNQLNNKDYLYLYND